MPSEGERPPRRYGQALPRDTAWAPAASEETMSVVALTFSRQRVPGVSGRSRAETTCDFCAGA
eukprot:8741019-Lingulodinium_polyedra.AAC.1